MSASPAAATPGEAGAGAPFLNLTPTADPRRWRLDVPMERCVGAPGHEFLFGGAGLGLSMIALQRTAQRPVIWATSQYVSYARPGEVLEIKVDLVNEGKSVTQARAVGRVDEREIFSVSAALGSRPGALSRQWLDPPAAPPPEALRSTPHARNRLGGLHSTLDVRVVHGRRGFFDPINVGEPDSRLVTWVRSTEGHPVDLAFLAVMGDLVPSAVGNAVGMNAGGNSLDNTLRINRLVPTRWVLSDVQILAVENGFVQGAARLFSEDGVLMATANQTMIMRMHPRPAAATPPDPA